MSTSATTTNTTEAPASSGDTKREPIRNAVVFVGESSLNVGQEYPNEKNGTCVVIFGAKSLVMKDGTTLAADEKGRIRVHLFDKRDPQDRPN